MHLAVRACLYGLLILGVNARALAQLSAAGAEPHAGAWAADVDVLLGELERLHPDMHVVSTTELWRDEATALRERLPSLTKVEAIWEFKRLVSLLHDSHTFVRAPEESAPKRWHPLLLRVFADGLYVKTGHIDHAVMFGRPIVAIGGVTTDELFDRLRPFMNADNDWAAIDQFKDLLRHPSLLRYVGADVREDDSVEYLYQDENGALQGQRVNASSDAWVTSEWRDADRADRPEQLWRSFEDNFGMTFLKDDGALYFRCERVRDGDQPIGEFLDALMTEADRLAASGELRTFIIDVRDNNGGNGELWQPLERWLIGHPTIDVKGRLFVLVSRDTFSASALLAASLEQWTNAIFVGEPPPHRPNFMGDTEDITLPASGITVRCSALHWQRSDPRDARPWITPDIYVVQSGGSFAEREDPLLGVVLSGKPQAAARWSHPNERYRVASRLGAVEAAPDVRAMLRGDLGRGTYIAAWGSSIGE